MARSYCRQIDLKGREHLEYGYTTKMKYNE